MNLLRIATCVAALMTLSAASAEAAPALATNNVNMRQGPGTNYPIITTIPGGSTVEISGCQDQWCTVVWQGRTGYSIATSFDQGAGAPPPGAAGPPLGSEAPPPGAGGPPPPPGGQPPPAAAAPPVPPGAINRRPSAATRHRPARPPKGLSAPRPQVRRRPVTHRRLPAITRRRRRVTTRRPAITLRHKAPITAPTATARIGAGGGKRGTSSFKADTGRLRLRRLYPRHHQSSDTKLSACVRVWNRPSSR